MILSISTIMYRNSKRVYLLSPRRKQVDTLGVPIHPPMDDAFIHFSTEAQIERTVAKFFADVPKYVILKVDTAKLKGELVYESNPGSTSKYYHIYNGAIPRSAVVECKLFEHHK